MKLAYTIVYVQDVPASLAFFEQAFGIECRFLHESGTYGELATGDTALSFVRHDMARASLGHDYRAASDGAPLGMEVAFATDDVPTAYARALKAGAFGLAAPVAKPWGQTVAYVRCPDGTLVELCTPMG